ncbi:hypothetical protein OE165_27205, partial [Escherichia coli]|uniref:hypothetical protein n=1 Tax=Escherichia coli TaxID=562 RepID=UPI0021F2D14A
TKDKELGAYYTPLVIQGNEVKEPYTGSGVLKKIVSNYLDIYTIPHSTVCGPFTKVSYEDFNANSKEQLKRMLLQHGWIPDEFTPSGMPS